MTPQPYLAFTLFYLTLSLFLVSLVNQPNWFPLLVLSCLGSLSTQLTLVLAYTLPNAHVGHLKMSEDFA